MHQTALEITSTASSRPWRTNSLRMWMRKSMSSG